MVTQSSADPEREFLPQLELDNPARQRRWTVLLRLVLAIPQVIVVYVLSIAADIVTIIGWFAALALGRLPDWIADFLSGYLRWAIRLGAYITLLVDDYPPFAWEPVDAAVRVELRPGRLNRLAVLFRIILAIPASILAYVLRAGWTVCAFFCWLVVLVMGRTPVPLFGATAAMLRYEMRYEAYWMMLTSAYPKGLFGDGPREPRPASAPGGPAPEEAGAERPDEGPIVTPPAAAAPSVPPEDAQPGVPPEGVQPGAVPESAGAFPAAAGGRPVATAPAGPRDTRPLLLTAGGRWLLILFIVVGVLVYIGNAFGNAHRGNSAPSGTAAAVVHVVPIARSFCSRPNLAAAAAPGPRAADSEAARSAVDNV